MGNGFPDADAVRKALPGWCVLGREDVEGILSVDGEAGRMWRVWEKVWAPEER